jgi:hypothetical protein
MYLKIMGLYRPSPEKGHARRWNLAIYCQSLVWYKTYGQQDSNSASKKLFFAQRIQTQKRCLGELVDDNVCMKSRCN